MPYNPESIVRSMKPMNAFEDWDTAVDLYRQGGGKIADTQRAVETIMSEAKRQMTPEELVRNRGNVNNIIDLVQRRIRPEETGMVKGAMTQLAPKLNAMGQPLTTGMQKASNVESLLRGVPGPGTIGEMQMKAQQSRGTGGLAELDKLSNQGKYQDVINLGKKMLSDPKYKEYAGGIQMMMGAAGKALTAIPLHSIAGLIMPRLQNPFSLTQGQATSL